MPRSARFHEVRVRSALLMLLCGIAGPALAGTVGGRVELVQKGGRRASDLSDVVVYLETVLPFENLSRDPEQDDLADGITDALITRLAQIGSVKVISRTSAMRYKHTVQPLREIARELDVEAVVQGTLLPSGERVRITAQLIDGATDAHLWAASYEREIKDVLALHAGIAGAIAGEIRATLTPGERARLRAARRVDPDAYKAYLRGRHLLGKGSPESIQRAIGQFHEAIDRDPSFAPAYAGLAQVYTELAGAAVIPGEEGRLRVRAAARKALEIDPQLADAYSALAWATVAWDWDWAEGERLFQKGLELKPNDAEGHRLYSDYLKCTGRTDEAVAEARRARELDPFSATVDYQLGNVLCFARRYDEAIAILKAPREGNPLVAQILLGFAYLQKGEHEKARAAFVNVREASPDNPIFLTPLAAGQAAAGQWREARALLAKVEGAKGIMAFPVAFIHVRLGDQDRAFAWLERSYRNREFFMGCVRGWPELDPLHSDPRYHALVERMRFPLWGEPAISR